MIVWGEPAIRGEMQFTAKTEQSSTIENGSTRHSTTALTIDVTGTTQTESSSFTFFRTGTAVAGQSPNTSQITTTSTNSGSASTSFTFAQTRLPATSTTTSANVFVTVTQPTTYETTKWTSELLGSGTATTVNFVSTETTLTDVDVSLVESTTVFNAGTATDTEGVTANVFDTVILCDHSEVAMIMTSYIELSDWDRSGLLAGNTTTGTRLTLFAQVKTRSVELFDVSTPTSSQSIQTTTFSTTFHQTTEFFASTFYDYKYSQLPNATSSYTLSVNSIVLSETQITSTLQFQFGHVGNTEKITTFYRMPQTSLNVFLDGRTAARLVALNFANLNAPEQILSEEVTIANDITHATEETVNAAAGFGRTIQAGGNSTAINTQHLQLACREQENLLAYDNRNLGQAWIVKPYGIVNGNSSAGFATITGTTFTETHMAYLSRHVPFINFESPRALRSLTTSSNDSFTIENDSITYTVTGSAQTTSQLISIEGEHQTGVVATKFVLGGSPEESATIYQSAPRGVFSLLAGDQTTTTLMADSHTVIEHPQTSATSVLLPVPYLTLSGNAFENGRVLVFHNQVIPSYAAAEYE